MVRDAVNNNKKKLDYKNISLATGMSRDEINQILFHYAVSLHNQIEYIENQF
jgi:beta-N-acetylglucosaminidase